jgi:hypothetical protein
VLQALAADGAASSATAATIIASVIFMRDLLPVDSMVTFNRSG